MYTEDVSMISNNTEVILGDSKLIEHKDFDGKKYKKGYYIDIYVENSNIRNNLGKTIQ